MKWLWRNVSSVGAATSSAVPSGWARVFLHDDNVTKMDFVIKVLTDVFGMKQQDAVKRMLDIHAFGKAACGDFPLEVAKAKVDLVKEMAGVAGFPLQCTMEKE